MSLRRGACRSLLAVSGAAVSGLFSAAPVRAHAFGPRYDLPLPLELYVAGAGAAVALSFVIMALIFRGQRAHAGSMKFDLLRLGPLRMLVHPVAIGFLQTASVGLFLLLLAAGLSGQQDPTRNFAPAFVWIVWWVGLAYVAALAGNVWPAINPWSAIHGGVERLLRRLAKRRRTDVRLAYPSWLGVWPAILVFWLFAWFELISESSMAPATLATAILLYSVFTWLGMAAFGRGTWLAHGEAFSLAFSVFGRFAPIGQPVREQPEGRAHGWFIRPYASALIVTEPCRVSVTVFVVLMLSTVTFDGLKETPLWGVLLQRIALAPAFHAVLRTVHDLGFDVQAALETSMLALFPALVLFVYLGFCWLTKRASGSALSLTEIAGLFVFSLVPIAIAYHLAHYLSYLLIAGQAIIPLASDPFGRGWDLFGTADYAIDIAVIGAKSVWYAAVTAIVVGHVCGIGVAHFVALRAFDSAKMALRSQYPLVILMVAYTMAGLWILAQPIVAGPDLGALRAPSGVVSLAPFEFRELCFNMRARDRLLYRFRSDGPLEFDIHYHDGLAIRYAVQPTAVTVRTAQIVAEARREYCLMWLNRSPAQASLRYQTIKR
ncbi:MAG: hypothetical protein QNJ94_18055 [Alphaproteobacteria bacterium]|nr:hypothetical protein [Alphaproteobacteria bacterium]